MVWLESHSLPNRRSVGFHSCLRVISPRANVGFSALRAKIRENHPIFTRNSAIFGYNLSVFQAKFSFLGSSFKRGGSFQREARSMSDF